MIIIDQSKSIYSTINAKKYCVILQRLPRRKITLYSDKNKLRQKIQEETLIDKVLASKNHPWVNYSIPQNKNSKKLN